MGFADVALFLVPPHWREALITTVLPAVVLLVLAIAAVKVAEELYFQLVWGRLEVENRVALITGAGSGIGRELSIQLAQRGCTVVLVDIRHSLIQHVKDHLVKKLGIAKKKVLLAQCDVGDSDAVARMAAQVRKALGSRRQVSLLVNNAGIVVGKAFGELTPEQVQQCMRVNCFAHFWLCREFLPAMQAANDGCVVAMSSLMGLMGGSRLTAYSASKHAILGFMESLRLELRRERCRGVGTLTVCPFAVATGMFDGIFGSEASDSWIRRIFFPFLSPDVVAREVVHSIQRRHSLLVLPWPLRYIPYIAKLAPVALYDFAVDLMAGCHGMDEFRGRGVAWAMSKDVLAHPAAAASQPSALTLKPAPSATKQE